MRCRFAFLSLLLLLEYAPIGDALASDGTSSKPRTAHSGPSHAISPRHHTLGSDGKYGTYRLLRMAPSTKPREFACNGSTGRMVRAAGKGTYEPDEQMPLPAVRLTMIDPGIRVEIDLESISPIQ